MISVRSCRQALACFLGLFAILARADDGTALVGPGDQRWSSFYRELARIKNGQRKEPLHILQLGDSHTASDYFSHSLRAAFQADYGDAGPGWLMPGLRRWWRSSLITIAQSNDWAMHSSFSEKDRGGPWALGGFTNVAAQPYQTMTYTLKAPPAQPVAGTLTVWLRAAGREPAAKFYGDQKAFDAVATSMGGGWQTLTAQLEQVPPQFTVLTGASARVDIAAVTLDYRRPGVVLDGIGIVGARVNLLDEWDRLAIDQQVKARSPALVILEYGTNEAYHRDFSRESYRAMLHGAAAWLNRHVPAAAVLLLGPPDALQPAGPCPARRGVSATRQRCLPAGTSAACAWRTHPNLAVVRSEMRAVAAENGWRYWDWSQVMGGECGAFQWMKQEPPLYRADAVHLFAAGYERSGAALYRAIMRDGGERR